MGLVGAAYGIGSGLGVLMGGVLGMTDLRLPFVAAAIMCVCSIAFVILFVPELDNFRDPARPISNCLNPVSNFWIVLRTPELRVLTGVFIFHRLGMATYEVAPSSTPLAHEHICLCGP